LKRSLLPPLYGKITDLISESAESIQSAAPEDVQKAQELILKHLPSLNGIPAQGLGASLTSCG
jgi:hypothetical protein